MTDDYDFHEAVAHQQNLDRTLAALIHGGASTAAGCWITAEVAEGEPPIPPVRGAAVILNGRLQQQALVAAAPHVVEMLRRRADDLECQTALPDHVPEAWTN